MLLLNSIFTVIILLSDASSAHFKKDFIVTSVIASLVKLAFRQFWQDIIKVGNSSGEEKQKLSKINRLLNRVRAAQTCLYPNIALFQSFRFN